MARTVIRKGRRKLCAGDFRDRVQLQGRRLAEPLFGDADFDEKFEPNPERWASVKTVTGRTIFDGASQRDFEVTHEVRIRFDLCVTSETWVKLADGRRLKILRVEDFEERHEYQILICTDRGIGEAAKA